MANACSPELGKPCPSRAATSDSSCARSGHSAGAVQERDTGSDPLCAKDGPTANQTHNPIEKPSQRRTITADPFDLDYLRPLVFSQRRRHNWLIFRFLAASRQFS